MATPLSAGERTGQLPPYIPELDGIRAVAVLMVIAMHLLKPDDQSSAALLTAVPASIATIIGHGWLGVDLFFVLSGFLITGILLEHPNRLKNFYARRVVRILPLYFLCIAAMACLYPGNGPYFWLSLFFLANMSASLDVPVPHGPGVFWSLAVEEHFYLVWPWLVRALSRRALTCVCASIIIAEPILRAIFVARGVTVYSLSCFRFDGLASGALLAIWFRSPSATRRRSLIAASLCVAAALAITIAGLPFHIMEKTIAGMSLRYNQATLVYCAGMLMAVSCRGSWITAPLRWGFARLTGDLSYCLYLIHLSLLDGYMAVFRHCVPTGLTFPALLFRAVVVLSASYGFALLSRRFFEGPILSLKRYLNEERGSLANRTSASSVRAFAASSRAK